MVERLELSVSGIVQGVGFRPFVSGLADELGLRGWVKNTSQGVSIAVEGEKAALENFASRLKTGGPLLARIDKIMTVYTAPRGEKGFVIQESSGGSVSTLVSPDMCTCGDCRREMCDPGDRRYRYPFINCTNCGPRFTILEQIPYDRKFTTMDEFAMCPECEKEYYSPRSRRFHAQPNACPACGPQVILQDCRGNVLARGDEVWEQAKETLQAGRIIAVKGLGGYHLCCDALNPRAVRDLRKRKFRWDKPFALMAADTDRVKSICLLSEEERELLESPRRPIVLLEKNAGLELPEEIAPRNRYLGVMLPYTPLHYLLMEGFTVLVMTSGNISDEPIAFRDEDALARLGGIADLFLTHNRRIFRPCDDSVLMIHKNRSIPLRRARGYAPEPLRLPGKVASILACGGMQKNTFCLTKDDLAFLSPHMGDLENMPTLVSFEEGIRQYKALFEIEPQIIAYDLHPEYLSSKYALDYRGKARKIGIQHHHAHIASCLADNCREGPVIGVSFDGTGYGTDGCLWGGEFLICDFTDFQRAAHLAYAPMPSGVMAVKETWRMAASYLYATYGRQMDSLDLDFIRHLPPTWEILRQTLDKKINAPLTSGCGRLFDGIAALIGLRTVTNYEGQAAVELEQVIAPGVREGYSFTRNAAGEISWQPVIRAVVEDIEKGESQGIIAAKFHNALAAMILEVCSYLRDLSGINTVAFSGGVFQNIYLLDKAEELLAASGFEVLTHSRVPPNDGGLSLGQALIAHHRA